MSRYWPARFALALAALVPVACGHSGSAAPPITVDTTTTSSSLVPVTTSTTTPATTPCPFSSDTVSAAADLVQLQARGASLLMGLISGSKAQLRCGTVRASAGGTANLMFTPRVANCQFTKDPASTKIGVVRTRESDGTLLRLANGQVTCTTAKPGQLLSLCGLGDIQPDGAVNQLIATCNPDPTFSVMVIGGSATVTDPSGKRFEMGANQLYDYNFSDPSSTTITDAVLTRSQTAVLLAQAHSLDVAFAIPTTTTTTPPNP